MVEKVTLARPYARAAFEAAQEHKDFERWSQMLAAAATTVADERVVKLLSSPRVQPTDLVELIAEASSAVAVPSIARASRYTRKTLPTPNRTDGRRRA